MDCKPSPSETKLLISNSNAFWISLYIRIYLSTKNFIFLLLYTREPCINVYYMYRFLSLMYIICTWSYSIVKFYYFALQYSILMVYRILLCSFSRVNLRTSFNIKLHKWPPVTTTMDYQGQKYVNFQGNQNTKYSLSKIILR